MMTLNSLSSQDCLVLENQALRRLQKALKNDNSRTVEYDDEELIID
jgi:hypothetical protein